MPWHHYTLEFLEEVGPDHLEVLPKSGTGQGGPRGLRAWREGSVSVENWQRYQQIFNIQAGLRRGKKILEVLENGAGRSRG